MALCSGWRSADPHSDRFPLHWVDCAGPVEEAHRVHQDVTNDPETHDEEMDFADGGVRRLEYVGTQIIETQGLKGVL